ncbi:MAG: BrnT family toxin, partial [Candidatus Poribacteria bacterium]
MRYEWSANKATANARKHRLTFDNARAVFSDPFRTVRRDDARNDYGEERWVTVGFVGGRLVVVVYTETDDTRRMISARKANSHEREGYD